MAVNVLNKKLPLIKAITIVGADGGKWPPHIESACKYAECAVAGC